MIDVLIPTYERPTALAVTLAALCFQDQVPARVIVSDQSKEPVAAIGEVRAVRALLEQRGVETVFLRNVPRQGLAQQRQFLLQQAHTSYILFLDDDIITEPWLLALLSDKLRETGCGFIGSAVIGLSFTGDIRPHQQELVFWDSPPEPEQVVPGRAAWNRHRLHNAANLLHVQQRLALTPDTARLYKIAWVGGCVLYDRQKLISVGGFDFWASLPPEHAGEDVFAQQRMMARYGGAGLIPSGAYHQEVETKVPDRSFDVPFRMPLEPIPA